MAQVFTFRNPPRSGYAKKIWDWWILNTGNPPWELIVNRPGKYQRSLGCPSYFVNNFYFVNKGDIENAENIKDLIIDHPMENPNLRRIENDAR